MLWELLNCEIPYRDVDSSAIIWGVGNSSLTLPIPANCPDGFKILLQQCWNAKPRNRPSFRQILMYLEIAAPKFVALDPQQFFGQQQEWRNEIRNCMKRMKRRRSSAVPLSANKDEASATPLEYKEELDILISKRKDELFEAQRMREEYEKKRECTNNLYMELMTCLLKLEQREKELIKRENEFYRRVGITTVNQTASIISPFMQKVPQVFQRELYDHNKVIPYSILEMNVPEADTDLQSEPEDDEVVSSGSARNTSVHYRPCHSKVSFVDRPNRLSRKSSANQSGHLRGSRRRHKLHVPCHTDSESESSERYRSRQAARPSVLVKETDRSYRNCKCKQVECATQTCSMDLVRKQQSEPCPQPHDRKRNLDKSTSTTSLDLTPNMNSPNSQGHSRLVPKMSTTSTFDSGCGDCSCMSTPSTARRFPDKSPLTPNSSKSGFENEDEAGEELSTTTNNGKMCTLRLKCRQSNSNTLPSLSSIDENGTNDDSEYTQPQQQQQTSQKQQQHQPRPSLYQTNYDSDSSASSAPSSLDEIGSDRDNENDRTYSSDNEESKHLLGDEMQRTIDRFTEAAREYCQDSCSSSYEDVRRDDREHNEDERNNTNGASNEH